MADFRRLRKSRSNPITGLSQTTDSHMASVNNLRSSDVVLLETKRFSNLLGYFPKAVEIIIFSSKPSCFNKKHEITEIDF